MSTSNSIHDKIPLKTKDKSKDVCRQTKAERIHWSRPLTIRSVKGSHSGKNVITEVNLNLHKEIKSTKNGNSFVLP